MGFFSHLGVVLVFNGVGAIAEASSAHTWGHRPPQIQRLG